MVRLSLVNLYLHGFTDPHIVEYDTLTSQERWNETADVILANPPFMSPKGGIKPHTRFSVQSKRSEVLFVDYMAEHLNTGGRAGIIVPEGIIFQSQTAYKDLRRMLVEKYLVAVISLPAGVFNPYSGVKTSILILDKALARQSRTLGFFKVENDGFGLGAQRREIAKNDLPQVQTELRTYLEALRSHQATDTLKLNCCQIVPKEKIAENGDWNLSGERYREDNAASSDFPRVPLSKVCSINLEAADPAELYPDSFFNYIDISCVENESGRFLGAKHLRTGEAPSRARRLVTQRDILLSTVRPNLKAFAILTHVPERAIASTGFAVLRANESKVLPEFLIAMLRQQEAVDQMIGMMGKGSYPSINQSDVESINIPLPPLEVQKEIVAEIEGYQKVIDGARAVLDNYRPHIPIHPDWPMVELGEVCDVRDGTHDSPKYVPDGYPLITSKNLRDGFIDFSDVNFITRKDLDAINKRSKVDAGDLLMPMIGTIGNPVIADESREYAVKNVALIKFPAGCKIDNRFLKDILDSAEMRKLFDQQSSGSTQRFISLGYIRSIKTPVPPLKIQQAIVAEIEAERALVAANRELIARFEKKIQATLARVWGEDEPTAPEA